MGAASSGRLWAIPCGNQSFDLGGSLFIVILGLGDLAPLFFARNLIAYSVILRVQESNDIAGIYFEFGGLKKVSILARWREDLH
jgi:hypothetical protein